MVHPIVITAAATAGVGAVVAFELAVFRPWRDENWPNGFGEGFRNEFLKLRREVEQAVTEIQDDLRTLRDGRRRGHGGHRRLSDDELDDFRRGIGEEASSESAQHEFEMHEQQAAEYRDRLRASMTESMISGGSQQDRGLRRRRPAGENGSQGHHTERTQRRVPVVDVRPPTSPTAPHHSIGDASSSFVEAADLTDPSDWRFIPIRSARADTQVITPSRNETRTEETENHAERNGLLGLNFNHQEPSASVTECAEGQTEAATAPSEPRDEEATTNDPFANIVDGTASSWHAVFSDRALEQDHNLSAGQSPRLSPASAEDLNDQGLVVLDTNGLSQTLSDQQHSFHEAPADVSNPPDSPYRSNRALQPPNQEAPSTGSRSARAESEPDFEVLSDGAGSEGRWSHLHGPPSPTISSGSEPAPRGLDVLSIGSDGEDSWAELSEPGSYSEGETRVRSVRG